VHSACSYYTVFFERHERYVFGARRPPLVRRRLRRSPLVPRVLLVGFGATACRAVRRVLLAGFGAPACRAVRRVLFLGVARLWHTITMDWQRHVKWIRAKSD